MKKQVPGNKMSEMLPDLLVNLRIQISSFFENAFSSNPSLKVRISDVTECVMSSLDAFPNHTVAETNNESEKSETAYVLCLSCLTAYGKERPTGTAARVVRNCRSCGDVPHMLLMSSPGAAVDGKLLYLPEGLNADLTRIDRPTNCRRSPLSLRSGEPREEIKKLEESLSDVEYLKLMSTLRIVSTKSDRKLKSLKIDNQVRVTDGSHPSAQRHYRLLCASDEFANFLELSPSARTFNDHDAHVNATDVDGNIVLKSVLGKGEFGEVFAGTVGGVPYAIKLGYGTPMQLHEYNHGHRYASVSSYSVLLESEFCMARMSFTCAGERNNVLPHYGFVMLVVNPNAPVPMSFPVMIIALMESPVIDMRIKTMLRTDANTRLLYIQAMLRALLPTLYNMHMRYIIHGDIKGDNVMLPKIGSTVESLLAAARNAKLADYSLARIGATNEEIMCPAYRPPETWLGLGTSSPGDVWALGCLCIEIFTGGWMHNDKIETRDKDGYELVLPKTESRESHIVRCINFFGQLPLYMDPLGKYKYVHPRLYNYTILLPTLDEKIPFHNAFVDLLRGMINMDPRCRLDCNALMHHDFLK